MKKYKGFQLNYFDLCYIHSLILDKEKEQFIILLKANYLID